MLPVADDLTDAQYGAVDRIEAALEAAGPDGLTPSAAGRKARVSTDEAAFLLAWMVCGRYAHTSGRGAWKRYHAGRAA